MYGNTVAARCERGQDLLYCPLFYTGTPRCVRNQIADLNSHWRTCRTCSRTMRVVNRTEAGSSRFWCEECIGSVANLARATGEFRSNTDGSRCESCSGCSYLQVTRGMEDVDVPLTPEGNSEAAKDKYLTEQHTQSFSGGFRRPKIESPNQNLRNVCRSKPNGHSAHSFGSNSARCASVLYSVIGSCISLRPSFW